MKESCIRKEHGGFCPECGQFVCITRGCKVHRIKGAQLLSTMPEKVKEAASKQNAKCSEKKEEGKRM